MALGWLQLVEWGRSVTWQGGLSLPAGSSSQWLIRRLYCVIACQFLRVIIMTINAGRTLVALAVLLCATASHANWIERSDAITMEVLSAQAAFTPEGASAQGLEEFDAGVRDMGPNYVQRRITSNKALLARLEKYLATEKHAKLRQDLAILINALEQENRSQSLDEQYMLPYFDLHRSLFFSFRALLDPRNEASRFPAAAQRLARYTGNEKGYVPLVQQARERSEERFGRKELLGPYIKELEANIDNAPRYVVGIRGMFEQAGLTGWEENFALLEQQLADYLKWQKEALLPRARTDNLLPPEVYANNLRDLGVDASPEELMEKAQYSYQLLRSEMKALAWQIAEKRGWQQKDLLSVIAALKAEQLPPEDVLPTYQKRLAAVEAIIEREDLVTLPDRKANIRLATEAESAAVPASFMSPPQLINNTGQYGEFVLVQSNPALGPDAKMDDFSHDAMTWALTVHEARPGHEMQFASLVENGTSLARAVYAANSANIEGWGLYAESIMHEFLPLEGQLFNLYTRIMRAARMFLDPMVNTG
jgi:Bacterial protein of unknown function (DUF885)